MDEDKGGTEGSGEGEGVGGRGWGGGGGGSYSRPQANTSVMGVWYSYCIPARRGGRA
jgi:hypothetical protein